MADSLPNTQRPLKTRKQSGFRTSRHKNGKSRSAPDPAAALALDPSSLPPVTKAISFDQRLTTPGSGMHAGDWIEILLPALLITAVLWFSNRIPLAEGPITPPSFGSSGTSSSGARASGSSSASTGSLELARPAPQRGSADERSRSGAGIASKTDLRKHTKQSVLSVDVDEKGTVTGIEVLESAGSTNDA